MQNQIYRVLVFSALFLIIFASCTLPTDRDSGGSSPPAEAPQEEPTTHVEGPPAPASPPEPTIQVEEPHESVSNSEPSVQVAEESPAGGGGGPSVESGAQNLLPPAVNLEKSSIDLQKLGTETNGGGGGILCTDFLGVNTEQEIILDNIPGYWRLCFINFPIGTALIKLSTQSGMFDTSVNLEPEYEGSETYALYIDFPASVRRDGPLTVEFNLGDVTFSEVFAIQSMDQVSIYQESLNILDAGYGYQYDPNYNPGEQIELLGVSLLPSTKVYVGIYGKMFFDDSWLYPLVNQFQITTNETGEFLGTFQITEKYHQGEYIIYYGYYPDIFENRQEKHKYERFTVGGITPTWQPCPADYASRLRVGDIGIVNNNPPLPNNVRSNPSLSGEMIGQLQPGEQFIILDGPVCEDGWVWWYVQGAAANENDQALMGWTSEGDSNNYWLIPYDPEEPKG